MCFAYQLPKNDNTRKNAHFTPPIVFIDSQKKKSAQTSINLSGYLFAIFCVSFSPFFYFVFCFFFIKTCRAAIWHASCNFFPYKNCYSIIIFFLLTKLALNFFPVKFHIIGCFVCTSRALWLSISIPLPRYVLKS